MRHRLLKKKRIILSSLLLAGCATAPPIVKCHEFGASDKKEIRQAIAGLEIDSPIHPIIKDYARVCIELNQ